jgi:hypothetical protein
MLFEIVDFVFFMAQKIERFSVGRKRALHYSIPCAWRTVDQCILVEMFRPRVGINLVAFRGR